MATRVPVEAWYVPSEGHFRGTFRGREFCSRSIARFETALTVAGANPEWVTAAVNEARKSARKARKGG